MSCSAPRPLSSVAVAPPNRISGDCAICAFLIAVIVFVTPGPAVTAAAPIVPVMRATASAANTALPSSRTSTTLIPRASQPVRIGEIWPPHSVNRCVTPCRARTSAMMSPPCRGMAATIDKATVSNLVLYSIPAFLALIVLEVMWARRHPEAAGYERRDTVASLSMGVANVAVSAGAKLLSIPFFALLYQHRVLDLGHADLAWSWLVLLVAEDFCYYWFHRCHHEVRLLWAVHVNHHSSQHYNLSTALRQALLTPLTGPIFWAPLALVGYPPWMLLTAQAWSLLYQFWLHTEAIDRLGPLRSEEHTSELQ